MNSNSSELALTNYSISDKSLQQPIQNKKKKKTYSSRNQQINASTYKIDNNIVEIENYVKINKGNGIQCLLVATITPRQHALIIPINPSYNMYIPRIQAIAEKYRKYKINTCQISFIPDDYQCINEKQIILLTKDQVEQSAITPCSEKYQINVQQDEFQPTNMEQDFATYIINTTKHEDCEPVIQYIINVEFQEQREKDIEFSTTCEVNYYMARDKAQKYYDNVYVVYTYNHDKLIQQPVIKTEINEEDQNKRIVVYSSVHKTPLKLEEKVEEYISWDNRNNFKLPEFNSNKITDEINKNKNNSLANNKVKNVATNKNKINNKNKNNNTKNNNNNKNNKNKNKNKPKNKNNNKNKNLNNKALNKLDTRLNKLMKQLNKQLNEQY